MWQSPGNSRTFQPSAYLERVHGRTRRHYGTEEKLIETEFDPQSLIIKDHNGDDVKLTWCPKFYDEEPAETLPPFPFQVYLTHGAKETIRDIPGFAERFACWVEWIGGIPDHLGLCEEHGAPRRTCSRHEVLFEDEYGGRCFQDGAEECHYRFEVYTKPQSNILACVAHQRKEVRHRGRRAVWPCLVSDWTTQGHGHEGKIIVIDRDDWTEVGLAIAEFDPVQHDYPPNHVFQNSTFRPEETIVEARRASSKSLFRECMRKWWVDAGHSWTERDLVRRNAGIASPALYPAVDPTAHYDVEHEDVHELDGTALPVTAAEQNSVDPGSARPVVVGSFDRDEFFKHGRDLEHLRSESYSDNFGLPVTSVWDPKLSSLRPQFSIAIYLSFDLIPVESRALFSCLNKGLIAKETWTLEVIRNMPSLEASFDYHSRASTRRTRARISDTNACVQMLLPKIVGHRLPNELLDYIQELLVPPEIPDYSSRPTRLFRNVFMYLDSSSVSTGPKFIYSDPAPFWPDTVSAKGAFSEPGRCSTAALRACMVPLCQIVNRRDWNRVADEIHILWSFCSPRLEIAAADMPRISLNVQAPPELIRARSMGHALFSSSFELHFSRPITVPIVFLSHNFTDMFEIVDLETGYQLPLLPYDLRCINSRGDSWSQSPELGFSYRYFRQRFNTLWPSSSKREREDAMQIYPIDWIEQLLCDESLLVEGHRYRVGLRPDVSVPRWTYGTREERSGYNLPPIPVVMCADSQLIFRYVGPERRRS